MNTVLGKSVPFPQTPFDESAQLVAIEALDRSAGSMAIRLSCPEFTSLCPVTGQPDFAHIVIDYVPSNFIVESKSLKLFLGSFRNHACYHENCTRFILKRLNDAISPIWARVSAFWFPRGGIPIDVFCQIGEMPPHVFLPTIDIPVYRAR